MQINASLCISCDFFLRLFSFCSFLFFSLLFAFNLVIFYYALLGVFFFLMRDKKEVDLDRMGNGEKIEGVVGEQ